MWALVATFIKAIDICTPSDERPTPINRGLCSPRAVANGYRWPHADLSEQVATSLEMCQISTISQVRSHFRWYRRGAGERIRTADLPLTRSMARSLGSATCTDATREFHHRTQNAGTFRSPVPRPVPRVQLAGLGLLGLSWADGAGVTRLPPQPPHNLNLVAASILEPEVPAGGKLRACLETRWVRLVE
jgi:hypothetical protein